MMKWFKHEGNARGDEKIEKLLMKYGVEGYGLYFYCIEIIAGNLSSDNITFELKHDAETIAHRLKMDTLRVEEIMKWLVNEGLFQFDPVTERVMCLGLLKRLDNTMSQNPEIRKMLTDPKWGRFKETLRTFKELPEPKSRREENKTEENKDSGRELKVRDPVIREYVLYHRKLYPGRPDPEIPFGKVGALLKAKRKRFSDEQLINIVRAAKDDSWIRKNDAYDLGTILAANVFNRLLRTGESIDTPPEPDTCPECGKPCIGGKCECGWGLQ